MSEDEKSKSRFGELAVELLGAKMASDLVREVWEHAPPEVKQALAVSVLDELKKRPLDEYAIRNVCDQWVKDTASALMAEPARSEMIRAAISARIDAVWQKAIENSVEHLVGTVVHEALQSTGRAIKEQLDRRAWERR